MAKKETALVRGITIIPFGSDAHKALLGVDRAKPESEAQAALLEALNTAPVPTPGNRKRPVSDRNYRPRTRYSPGDVIVDGWVRTGGR